MMVYEIAKDLVAVEYEPNFVFNDDINMKSGIKWVKEPLEFRLGGGEVVVTSPTLKTDLDITPRYAGMRYCKLLPVSRVVKHILINIFFEL
jgi:hypothetical protein